MSASLTLCVYGTPRPYAINVGRGGQIYYGAAVREWARLVETQSREQLPDGWAPLQGPLRVTLEFTFERPKSHFGTGRNSTMLKPAAPQFPITPPDGDKLTRSTCDPLTKAGVWNDDAQIIVLRVSKTYAPIAGVSITVEELRADERPPSGG